MSEVIWAGGGTDPIHDPFTRLLRLNHGEYEVEQYVNGEWQRVNTATKFEFMGECIEKMSGQILGATEAIIFGVENPQDAAASMDLALTILADK